MKMIESIYNEPEKWRVSEYTMRHESGAELWINNGPFFCTPHPGGTFSMLNRFRAWIAYRWWCKNAPVEAFGMPGWQQKT